jgi:gluconolactonase
MDPMTLTPHLTRRSVLAAAATTALAPLAVRADRDWSGKTPIRYPDPDVILIDKRFKKYQVTNAAIERLFTGCRWAEGPAWNGVGGYLVWSDIPNNRQMRWLAEDGHVSVFRTPCGNTAFVRASQPAHRPKRIQRQAYRAGR